MTAIAGGVVVGTAISAAGATGPVVALDAPIGSGASLSARPASGANAAFQGAATALRSASGSASLASTTTLPTTLLGARAAALGEPLTTADLGVLGFSVASPAESGPTLKVDAVRSAGSASGTSRSATSGRTPSVSGYAGLSANAQAVVAAVRANFPSVASIGGLRGGGGDHATGHAVDIMTSDVGLGTAVAEYLRANAGRLGITYVIWRQRIWSAQRSSEGWRWMANRGSATANHYDHVHVSVS